MDLTEESNRQPGVIKAKRPGTLDLANTSSKKKKFASILSSPDLMLLTLTSPELERFIMTHCDATKTPSPTQVFPENVTEEQENSTDKCAYAFSELHLRTVKMDTSLLGQNINPPSFNPVISKIYGGLLPVSLSTTPAATNAIKLTGRQNCNVLRAQNPPICPPSIESSNSSSCSLPVSSEFQSRETNLNVPLDFSGLLQTASTTPIDMADQERIKREIKRYRNRIAASKCRKRKLEKISQLESEKRELKEEIARLEASASSLHKEVSTLKEALLYHVINGCKIMTHNLS